MEELRIQERDHVVNGDQQHGFDIRNNPNSQTISDVLKCCLIKLLVDGKDMVLKDAKSRKTNGLNSSLKEFSFHCKDSWKHEHVNISIGGYTEFLMNFLTFLPVLMIKLVGFQFNLSVTFFSFPMVFLTLLSCL